MMNKKKPEFVGVQRGPRRGGMFAFWTFSFAVAFGITVFRYYPMTSGYAEGEAPAVKEAEPVAVAPADQVELPAVLQTAEKTAEASAPSETKSAEGQSVGNYLEILKLYKNLQQDQDNILTQLKIAYGERDKMKGEIELLKEESKQTIKDKESLQKQNADLRKAAGPMTAKMTKQEDVIRGLERESEADKARISQLEKMLQGSEVSIMKDELRSKEKIFLGQKAELEKMVSTANRDREQIQSRSVQKENRIYNLEMELADMTQKYEGALEENRSLRARFETVNNQMLEIAREKDKAIKETADMHYNLGVFYVEQKNFERALLEFQKATEWRPNDALSHYNMGLIYSEHLVDEEKAITSFQRYLDLQPEAKDRNHVEGLLKSITYWRGRPKRV